MREMNNKKKERPAEWALALLGRCEYACLSLVDGTEPYCVPVSHVLVGDRVYFHSSPRGYKAELLAASVGSIRDQLLPSNSIILSTHPCSLRYTLIHA